MSRADDRIPVPGNGHRPPLTDDAVAGVLPPTRQGPAPGTASGAPVADEPRIAFTPGQVAIGFGIIASLILLVVGRRRRGRPDA